MNLLSVFLKPLSVFLPKSVEEKEPYVVPPVQTTVSPNKHEFSFGNGSTIGEARSATNYNKSLDTVSLKRKRLSQSDYDHVQQAHKELVDFNATRDSASTPRRLLIDLTTQLNEELDTNYSSTTYREIWTGKAKRINFYPYDELDTTDNS